MPLFCAGKNPEKGKKMLNLTYQGEKKTYEIAYRKVSDNIIQITGDFPVKEKGFVLSRIGENDNWDKTEFRTIYRQMEYGAMFSNDGSVYVEPEPVPEPEQYTPTLEEIKVQKISEMNTIQQDVIKNGTDITLSDGTIEHFGASDHDQISLLGLAVEMVNGATKLRWHVEDDSIPCKYYDVQNMTLIQEGIIAFVTFHVTYFKDLKRWINSMETIENVQAVQYGAYIPEEYQSEVLRDIYMAQGVTE